MKYSGLLILLRGVISLQKATSYENLRYLNDLLNTVNLYFEQMVHVHVSQIYPTELIWNTANSFETDSSYLDLDLYINNEIVSSEIYDKRYDFNFEIVNAECT